MTVTTLGHCCVGGQLCTPACHHPLQLARRA